MNENYYKALDYNPLISIIVPVFDTAIYLRECLNSIINQSYFNLEIILINDGSTDESGNICEEYALVDSRIIVFHQDNAGPAVARNLALDNAKGDYIAFIDSDDFCHYQFIEILMQGFSDKTIDVSFCNFSQDELDNTQTAWQIMDFNYLYLSFQDYLTKVLICNKLYNKKVWKLNRFIPDTLHEDIHIYHKLFYNRKLAFSENKLYYYRRSREGNRTSENQSEKNRLSKLEAYVQERKFFIKNGEYMYVRSIEKKLIYAGLFLFYKFKNLQAKKILKRHTLVLLKSDLLVWKEKISLIYKLYIYRN